MLNHLKKLSLCISSVLVCAPAVADNAPLMQITEYDERCYGYVPEYVAPDTTVDIQKVPISITADSMESNIKNNIKYDGDVEIIQGNKRLKADKTTFNQHTQEMTASGNILYEDGQITVSSDTTLYTNLATNSTELHNATYMINGSVIRGSTEKAVLNNENKTISLYDASVTTCPKHQPSWVLNSSEVNIDQNEVFGEAYHTVFRFHDVPVLYLPYFNFPIKNERKSGLLYPNIEYTSSDGGMLTLPIYWNIAPNYDFTYSPKIITRRGLLNTGEFRYMPFRNTYGSVYGQYISHDRHYKNDGDTGINHQTFDERWIYYINHETYFSDKDYGFLINFTRIRSNDYNYVNDFDPKVPTLIDNQLVQSGKLYVDKNNFDANLLVQKYQLLVPNEYIVNLPFKLVPRVEMNYHDTIGSHLAYRSGFEYSRFRVEELKEQSYKGDRYHFQPEIELPILNKNGIDVRAIGRGFLTHYEQDIPSTLYSGYVTHGFTPGLINEKVNRYLYNGEIYSKATFVNNTLSFKQTLEPEIQYMYIPYRNQDHIGIYDSTDRVYDYYSLFGYRKYAGLDRIADTNRISYGITYRMYDNELKERLRFNIGQGYDFHSQKVKFYPNETSTTYPRTPIATGINLNFLDYVSANGNLVYNTEKGETSSWNSQLNGMYEEFKVQLSYRYLRDGNQTMNGEISDLKQLGGAFNFPITEDIKGVAAMYYDLERSRNIDQKLALKYESCCYSIGFQIERFNKPDNYTLTAKNETKYGVFFELKGLTDSNMNASFSPETKLIPYNNAVNLNK